MNAPSQDNFAELLTYKEPSSDSDFTDRVMKKISHRQKARKRLLALSGVAATITATLLVGTSSPQTWQPISEFISQSPMLVTSVIVVTLLSGLLIRTEEI